MKRHLLWVAWVVGLGGCTELPLRSEVDPQVEPCQRTMIGEVEDPAALTAAGLSAMDLQEEATWVTASVRLAWGEVLEVPVSVSFDPGDAQEVEYVDAPDATCEASGSYLEVTGRVRVEVEGLMVAEDRVVLSGSADHGVSQLGVPFSLQEEGALQEVYEASMGETCTVFRPVGRLDGSVLRVQVLGTCGGRDVDEPLFEADAEG